MKKKYVVGVDLGGSKIYTALVDLEGNIMTERRELPTYLDLKALKMGNPDW